MRVDTISVQEGGRRHHDCPQLSFPVVSRGIFSPFSHHFKRSRCSPWIRVAGCTELENTARDATIIKVRRKVVDCSTQKPRFPYITFYGRCSLMQINKTTFKDGWHRLRRSCQKLQQWRRKSMEPRVRYWMSEVYSHVATHV